MLFSVVFDDAGILHVKLGISSLKYALVAGSVAELPGEDPDLSDLLGAVEVENQVGISGLDDNEPGQLGQGSYEPQLISGLSAPDSLESHQ